MNKHHILITSLAISCLSLIFPSNTFAQINAMVGNQQCRETIFVITEVPPKPVGGMSAFFEYTEDNLKRPQEARQKGISGNVYVQFIIERDGRLSNVKILKGLGFGCDEAVINLLEKAPKWNPGKQNGQIVRVQKTMSIRVH